MPKEERNQYKENENHQITDTYRNSSVTSLEIYEKNVKMENLLEISR